MQTPGTPETAYVLVEYAFEYTAKDGRLISIKPHERYILLKRTNDHWWHVRQDEHSKPFYIPAKYVKELPPRGQPANGLQPHSEPQHTDSVNDTSSVDSQQYSYKFVSEKNDMPPNPLNQKSSLHHLQLSQAESGSNLSIPDIVVSDIVRKGSREDLLPRIGEEKSSSTSTFTPLRTFGSFHRLPIRKTMYGPEFASVVSIRSSQSLDDLARLTPERQIGGRRTQIVAGARVHSRSLTRSDSENIYETIRDVTGQRNMVTPQAENKSKNQASQEKISSPVYVNISELRQEAAKSGTSSRLQSSSSNLDEWETHTDKESGKLFYYNNITRETTWDSPYYQPEEPGTSPGSLTSATSLTDPEWERYFDEPSGRFFFHNSYTGETSWQPPEPEELSPREMKSVNSPFYTMEQRPPTPETDYPESSPVYDTFPEEDYSPPQTPNSFIFPYIQPQRSPSNHDAVGLTPGYTHEVKDGKRVYTDIHTHETWILSKDDHGQNFFHSPDGSDSRWHLPLRPPPRPQHRASVDSEPDSIGFSTWNSHPPAFIIPRSNEDPDMPIRRNALDFTADKRQSMVPESIRRHPKSLDKAGVLHKTKIAENGKRLRKKNWSTSWTVLEGSILTFYKDNKNLSTSSMKQTSNFSTPEYTVDLQGASISWAPKEKSSKKNVLELKTRTGSEFLIQHDTEYITEDWYNIILDSIQTMSTDTLTQPSELPRVSSPNGSAETLNKDREEKEKEKKTPVSAQKSHDIGTDSDSSRVRSKLKRLLQRRPTMQSLRDKGYIKDQVFGCHLHVLCEREKTSVPKFVRECIKTVENRGLDIDGLYRISGNLATIQKLRFKVDHDENFNLDNGRWEDVHVITGALKLFFRELPEPLFPFSHFDRFIGAIKIPDPKAQMKYMKELVQSLPPPNHETMKALFQHLCRVIEKHEENRMSVKSVAIVFGPTLLKRESEGGNIAVHMVFQNQIVELILSNCNYLFADS